MRPEIVAEALEWVGTPFRWQASLKGVGADCKGFVWGVARNCGLSEAESLYARMADYSVHVPTALLLKGLRETLTQVREPEPGDVPLMNLRGKAQHLGIYTGDDVIHAYVGSRRVIAQPYAIVARHFPIHSFWRFG